MPPLQPRELYPSFRKGFGYLVKSGGKGALSELVHATLYRVTQLVDENVIVYQAKSSMVYNNVQTTY